MYNKNYAILFYSSIDEESEVKIITFTFRKMVSDIFQKVKSLNLQIGHYTVIGSGVMAAHGIRDYKDIDLLVTPELYEKLKKDGWKEKAVRPDFIVIENGIFEASPNIMTLPTYKPEVG